MFLSGAAAELASGSVGSESSSLFGYSFVVISLVGMVGSFLLWYLRIIFGSLLFRFMFYQLNLSDTCVEYGWFSLWFSHHPYTKSGSSHIKPFQKSSKQRVVIRTNEPKEEDSIATTNISEMISNLKVNFVPGYGIHVVYRKGEPLIISISVNTNNNNMYSQEEKTREDIVIWKPRHFITEALVRLLFPCQNGVNNSNSVIEMLENAGVAKEFLSYNPTYPKSIDNAYSVFRELLCDCFYVHTLMTREKTSVYTPYYQQWTLASFKEKRAQHTVILDEGVWEDLHNDVTKFLKSKQWYKDRGIPYRRGYLLYGEPGCGKTTTISSIAACLNMNICVFSLDSQTTDASMQMLFSTVPPNSILVFEDIDSIFPKEDDEKKSDSATDDISQGKSLVKTNSKTTFSAILNCLDGISSQESRIVFMTTNFKEKLPPALIRNGRVDRKIYLGLATKHQFYKMTQNFYPDEYTTEKVDEMWENVKQFSFGMANLQGFFLRNETLDAAVKSSHDFEKYMKEETQNQ